jgi:hypothetical protein
MKNWDYEIAEKLEGEQGLSKTNIFQHAKIPTRKPANK